MGAKTSWKTYAVSVSGALALGLLAALAGLFVARGLWPAGEGVLTWGLGAAGALAGAVMLWKNNEWFAGVVRRAFKRYMLDALSAMALGLFSSLIIGLIISQLALIPGLAFLSSLSEVVAASSPVVGAVIGAAVAWGLKVKPLAIFSAAVAGAIGYNGGGPVGCYLAAVVGAEAGNLISGKTPVDIVLVPLFTIFFGGMTGIFAGPVIGQLMTDLGALINAATELAPIPMGIAVSALMGMILTAPISSAALSYSLGLSGLAAGAATAGCSAQMIGFAVASWRENKLGGFLSQGFGTSMLQVANIVRRPQIWIPPTLASMITGPLATAVFHMQNNAAGAGMGTSGLVGQISTWAVMSGTTAPLVLLGEILLLHFVLPAVLTLFFSEIMRKKGWISYGDMKLDL